MKFKTGDRVKKINGYKYNGVVVAGYKVDGGIRYDVQIDGKASVSRLNELMKNKEILMTSARVLMEVEELLMNCHGMIHIFSEEQIMLQ